ncbi:MAG: hypothetical protein HOO67_02395 [Candidatus Peribacteraceae bacterium]|nr:hypothetical protein [Candidatus Peribacteraceae bacterium]
MSPQEHLDSEPSAGLSSEVVKFVKNNIAGIMLGVGAFTLATFLAVVAVSVDGTKIEGQFKKPQDKGAQKKGNDAQEVKTPVFPLEHLGLSSVQVIRKVQGFEARVSGKNKVESKMVDKFYYIVLIEHKGAPDNKAEELIRATLIERGDALIALQKKEEVKVVNAFKMDDGDEDFRQNVATSMLRKPRPDIQLPLNNRQYLWEVRVESAKK